MKCFRLLLVLAWVCAVQCDYRGPGKLRGPPHAPHPPLPPKIHYGPRPPPSQVFYGQGGGPRPRPHSRPSGGIRGGPYSYKAHPKPHFPVGPPSHPHPHHGSSQSLLSFSGIQSHGGGHSLGLGGHSLGGQSLGGHSLGGHGHNFGGQVQQGSILSIGAPHHGIGLQSSHGLLNNARPSGLSHHSLLNHAGPASQAHHSFLNDVKQQSHHLLDHKPLSFTQGVLHHRLRPQVVKETFSHSLLNQHQSQPFNHGFLDDVKPHLNSVLDDNKGPIHTIPAPNLSHADKPHGYHGVTAAHQGGGGAHLGGFGLHQGGGGAAAVGLSVAHGLGLGNVEIHHSQGYEVHQEPETNDQTGVTPDGRPAYYAPDPDPSLPAHRIPATNDPFSHPSNGKQPLDIIIQQQREQQQQQFGDVFQQQHQQQQHGDLFLQQQQQQQQQNKFNDVFGQQQQQQQPEQGQLTPDNFLQLFNYGGGGQGGGDFPQQAVDSYGVPVGQESQHHEYHQASQGSARPSSGGADNTLGLKTRQQFSPNFQSFNYDEQRDAAGAGSEIRSKVVQRNTAEGTRTENQPPPHLLGDSFSTLPSREAAETLATLQAAGDIISQVHQRQNEVRDDAKREEQKRTEYSVESHVTQSQSNSQVSHVRKKEEANPSVNEVRGDIPVNEDDYDDEEEEEERNIIIVRPEVGPIPGSVFYDNTPTAQIPAKTSESLQETVVSNTRHTIEKAVPTFTFQETSPTRHTVEKAVPTFTFQETSPTRHTVEKAVPTFTFQETSPTRHTVEKAVPTFNFQETSPTRHTIEKAVPTFNFQETSPIEEAVPVKTVQKAAPVYNRHNIKEVTITPRPTHARPSFAIQEDEPTYIESLPTFHDAVPSYTKSTRPITQDAVSYTKSTRPITQDAVTYTKSTRTTVPTYTRTTRPANQNKTPTYTRSKPTRPTIQKDESSDYDYQGSSDHTDQESSEDEEVQQFAQEFGARIKTSKKT